jgi:hypothetical protein
MNMCLCGTEPFTIEVAPVCCALTKSDRRPTIPGEPEAVAPLTRLGGRRWLTTPTLLRLTWTALDVGGPCVAAFG